MEKIDYYWISLGLLVVWLAGIIISILLKPTLLFELGIIVPILLIISITLIFYKNIFGYYLAFPLVMFYLLTSILISVFGLIGPMQIVYFLVLIFCLFQSKSVFNHFTESGNKNQVPFRLRR